MMRLCVCVWFVVLMCVSHWCNAQVGESQHSDIAFGTNDTTWVINYSYAAVESPTFNFNFTVPSALPNGWNDYKFVVISWGEGREYSDIIPIGTYLDSTYNHNYPSGRFLLTIKYYKNEPSNVNEKGEKGVCTYIFNQKFEGKITIKGEDGGCIESGVDTFYVYMEGHDKNPPTTKYEVEIRSDAPGADSWNEIENPEKDSVMIVFNQANGQFGADIRFSMTVKEGYTKYEVTDWVTVNIYSTPNLNAIFNFRDSPVQDGENPDIEACTNEGIDEIDYNKNINKKYFYTNLAPDYEDRSQFTVDYYRRESKDSAWIDVTANTDPVMVDTTGMIFKYPGYYRIKMIAHNGCGADTLDTELIKGSAEKRHIIVYQNSYNKMRCNQDTICNMENGGKEITFVDFGERFEWDDTPTYDFFIKHTKDDTENTFHNGPADTVSYYNEGEIVTETTKAFKSDSTLLGINFDELGIYDIILTRGNVHCTSSEISKYVVRVGGEPKLSMDSLRKYILKGDTVKEIDGKMKTCDVFNFVQPNLALDSNYIGLDTIFWEFQKGPTSVGGTSQKDTILYGEKSGVIYKFDSISNIPNNIMLKAHNFCGWDTVNVDLYTNLTPKMELWRNNIESNDTLCLGKTYDYHWVGDVPDQYSIRGRWSKGVIVNKHSISIFDVTDVGSKDYGTVNVGKIKFEEAGLVEENFYIKNNANTECKQTYEKIVTILNSSIKITGIDTIKAWPLGKGVEYHFVGDHVEIGVNDLKKTTWKVLKGNGKISNENSLKGAVYKLGDDEKGLDTLSFELSGKNALCEAKDTLDVIIPRMTLKAEADTICNGEEYSLWGEDKTYGTFIKLDELEWEILKDKSIVTLGTLSSSSTGNNVKYTPSLEAYEADTVKIVVKAWHLYRSDFNVGPDMIDTIYLKVNPAPQHIFPDTLYLKAGEEAGARQIVFKDIKRYKTGISEEDRAKKNKKIGWALLNGEGKNAKLIEILGHKGVYIGTPPGDNNYSTNLNVTYTAYKGCSDSTKKVVFMGVVPPKMEFKNIKICHEIDDEIPIEYTIKGSDKFTTQEVLNVVGGNGSLNKSVKPPKYTIGSTYPTEFTLEVKKEKIPLYNADKDTSSYLVKLQEPVASVEKPQFELMSDANHSSNLTHDTICWEGKIFKYQVGWIKHIGGNYSVNDFVTTASVGLEGEFPDFKLKDSVYEAKFIVSVDLGTCEKWDAVTDTVHITRLKKMEGNFSFENNPICEGQKLTVSLNPTVDSSNKGYSWRSSGGESLIGSPLSFKPKTTGTLSMLQKPPHSCPEDTITMPFEVVPKPSLGLDENLTICKGSSAEISFNKSQVDSIVWKANGRKFAATKAGQKSVKYDYDDGDRVNKKIQIICIVTPSTPCIEDIRDTIEIEVLDIPIITPPAQDISVCQGETLVLNNKVKIEHGSDTTWTLNGPFGEIDDTDPLNIKYIPGENSGEQILKIEVEGLRGCPAAEKTARINVKKSIKPEVARTLSVCQNTEMTLTHTGAKGGQKKWFVNGVEKFNDEWELNYTFREAGDSIIRIETRNDAGECLRSDSSKITIKPAPEASFTMMPDSIVGADSIVRFEGLKLNNIREYEWYFYEEGDSVDMNDNNRIRMHKFDLSVESKPSRKARLVVTADNSCTDTIIKELKVIKPPIANFDTVRFNKCTGEIEFQNSSTGEDISYSWDFGNEKVLIDKNPINISYTPLYKDSTYTIVLTVNNVAGVDTDTMRVTVVSELEVKLVHEVMGSGDCGDLIRFNVITKGETDYYNFNWGDGTSDTTFTSFTEKYIYYEYSNEEETTKIFIVKLTAKNACSNDIIETANIKIRPNNSKINFSYIRNKICFGDTVAFMNESSGFGAEVQAYWSFGGNTIQNNETVVDYCFDTPGIYPVKLLMTDNCNTYEEKDTIRVYGSLSLDFDMTEVSYCSGEEIELGVLPSIKGDYTNFKWNIGGEKKDGDFLKIKLEKGSHEINLTAEYVDGGNCPTTTTPTKSIVVYETPVASILPSKDTLIGCTPYIVSEFSFEATEYGTAHWDFKNEVSSLPNVTDITFSEAGEYSVQLTLESKQGECISRDSILVIANQAPQALFTVPDSDTLFCVGGEIDVTFDNHSREAESYTWSYENENKETIFSGGENPNLKLSKILGDIELKLLAKRGSCADSLVRTIMSGEPITLAFDQDAETTFCGQDEVSLGFEVSDSDATKLIWNKGYGEDSTLVDISSRGTLSCTYDDPEGYTTSLIAINKYRCRDTATHNFTGYPYLTSLGFETSAVLYCSGQDIEFRVSPSIKADYTDFSWSLGDGTTEVGKDSIVHKYIEPKSYAVTLEANSINGLCPSSDTIEIVVDETPFTSILPSKDTLIGCTPYIVSEFSFEATEYGTAHWDFKNEEISSQANVTDIRFSETGEYLVQLSLESKQGCIGRDSILVIVKKTPQASFSFPNVDTLFCRGGEIDIKLTNETLEPDLSSFEWSYTTLDKDSIFYRGQNPPDHLILKELGEIHLKLLVKDNTTQCTDELIKTIVSGHSLKLEIEMDTALCDGEILHVKYSTLYSDATNAMSYLGDGTTDVLAEFNYVYDTPGEYEFKVVAENSFACKDTLERKITVYPLPIADFYFEKDNMAFAELNLPEDVDLDQLPDVENGIVRFTNSSTVDKYDFAISTLYSHWNFGDSIGSNMQDPLFHFSNNGSYEVKLLIKTSYGCADSIIQFVFIDGVKGLFIPNAFAPGAGENNPGVALFQPKGIGLLTYKIQVYADGGTCVWSSDKLIEGRPAEAWDGTFNGEPIPKGNYIWKASAIFIDGSVWEGERGNGNTNGKVLLIR